MINEKNDEGDVVGVDGGTLGGGGGTSGIYPSSHEHISFPSLFVTKLHNMVNDSNTNFIISWGSRGTSLIIWDHNKFSAELLPAYFKHRNFSSFIYQLNNYGFRKIGWFHQWEYENPNFQAGKEYLLANIKRRNQVHDKGGRYKRTRSSSSSDTNNISDHMETKLEILRNEIKDSKLEIEKLKTRQLEIELLVLAAEARWEKDRMYKFLKKACVEGLDNNNTLKSAIGQRGTIKENEVFGISEEKTPHEGEQDMVKKDGLVTLSNKQYVSISSDDSATGSSVRRDHEINEKCEPGEKNELGGYKYWEQIILLDEEEVCENDGTKEQQAEITAELEDLLAKPPN